jgi:microcystin-dependent protein
MPNHTHTPRAKAGVGTSSAPTSGIWAGSHGDKEYAASADTTMSVKALTTAGGGEAHANMPPFLCVNFIIALEGIFPSRP